MWREPGRFRGTFELADHSYGRNILVKRFDQSEELLDDEENCCACIVQNVSEFSRCEPDVQWQKNRAGFQNPVIGFEQAVAIGAEESHAVTGLDTCLPKCARKAPRAVGKFCVCKPALITDHRGSAGVLLLRITKEAQWGKRD